ncbi:unnamed protein product [Acanthosepion pharaonis]|uniref:Uncharacterized protein n=1 Tax=Acanthosepion pharaonis TaxID=158019 RepID=A0A812EDT6_ACAPH|nr:unnamed protein product [Sepia pharaonis]
MAKSCKCGIGYLSGTVFALRFLKSPQGRHAPASGFGTICSGEEYGLFEGHQNHSWIFLLRFSGYFFLGDKYQLHSFWMKMRTKATKTKCIEKDESAPAPKVLKVEPSPTTETDGGGGEGGGGGSSSSNKICQMCGKVHNNDDIFKYLSVLPEDERYKCHYCSESFSYSCLFAAHIRACSNAYSSNPNNKKPNSTNNYPTTSVSTVTTAGNDVKNIVSPSVTTSNTSSNIYTKREKINISISVHIYLSIYLCSFMPIYLFRSLNISLYLSLYISIYLSSYISIYLSQSLIMSFYLSLYLSIYLSISVS